MVRRAIKWTSPVIGSIPKCAFGEHEWLSLEAVKQIPESPSETLNELVPNMPSKGLPKHEQLLCEF